MRLPLATFILGLAALIVFGPVSAAGLSSQSDRFSGRDALQSATEVSPTPVLTPSAPTAQPTAASDEVEVIVETQGYGIPDDVILETDYGSLKVNQREELGPNHFREHLQVRLQASKLWVYEHEAVGDLPFERWESFDIVEATVPMAVFLHNPVAPCEDPTMENCNYVTGTGDHPSFKLTQRRTYYINLRVDYSKGSSYYQDRFTVTWTIK